MEIKVAEQQIRKAIDLTFISEPTYVGQNIYGTDFLVLNQGDRPNLHKLAHRPMNWDRFLTNRAVQRIIESNRVFQYALACNGVFISEGYTMSVCVCWDRQVFVMYLPERIQPLMKTYAQQEGMYMSWPMLQDIKRVSLG